MTTEIKEKKTIQQKLNLALVLLVYICFSGLVLYLHQIYYHFKWLGLVGTIIYPEIIFLLNKKWKFL